MYVDLGEISRHIDLSGGKEKNRLHRATSNGVWLSSVPYCLKGMQLSQEEFWDNLCLRYRLMPQDIPATFDGCGKRFLIEHALS